MMRCSKCEIDKNLEEFPNRNNKPRNPCKKCSNELSKLSKRKSRIENKDFEELKRKIYLFNNSDRIKIVKNNYRRNKYKNDIEFNIEHRFRSRLQKLTKNLNSKTNKSIFYLGCTKFEFKEYLESKFIEGMSWENRDKWHIDHIIPCAKFNLSDQEELIKCFNYKNLQPLWAKDNILKRDN
jgi:hypothetical protein